MNEPDLGRRVHLRSLFGLGLALTPLGCDTPRERPRDGGTARQSVYLPAARPLPTPHIDDDDDDQVSTDVSCTLPTEPNIEGPFFKPGAPDRSVLAERGMAGTPLIVEGRVLLLGDDCRLTPCAFEVWHADDAGRYDLDGFKLRGVVQSGDGQWSLRTILPGLYLNGSAYRPRHIHLKVDPRPNPHLRRGLTTQLYFAGDPHIEGDPFVRPSLVMDHTMEAGVMRARFDIVLA